MKNAYPGWVFIVFILVALSGGCGGGGGSGPSTNDNNPGAPVGGANDPANPASGPVNHGVSWLAEGNFWLVSWSEADVNRSWTDVFADYDAGSYSMKLGPAVDDGDYVMHEIILTGDTQNMTPPWSYIGADRNATGAVAGFARFDQGQQPCQRHGRWPGGKPVDVRHLYVHGCRALHRHVGGHDTGGTGQPDEQLLRIPVPTGTTTQRHHLRCRRRCDAGHLGIPNTGGRGAPQRHRGGT